VPKTCEQVHAGLFWYYGSASDRTCIACGNPARDWAYQYTAGDAELVNEKGTRYSENFEDYAPMCRRCHFTFDSAADPVIGATRGLANVHGRVAVAELRRRDPVFDEMMREAATVSLAKARQAIEDRRASDPSYDAFIRENRSAAGKKAVEVLKAKRAQDPALHQAFVERCRRQGRARRRCTTCNVESNAMGMGTHLKWSGHEGWEVVTDAR
jgi:hypothetical protein